MLGDNAPSESPPLSSTPRTRLRRYPKRARTERAELYQVLDTALVCFLGVVTDGHPRVIPMAFGRVADTVYLHGSVKNQALVAAREGAEVCVTVTHVSGLVLANSLFHHSMNFRSAMMYGECRVVTDDEERIVGLRAAADRLVPGRSAALPAPTPEQLRATIVLALPLAEASVKVRDGSPNGDAEDYERDVWAGVLPLNQTWADPEDDDNLRAGIPVPDHVARLVGRRLETPDATRRPAEQADLSSGL